MDRRPRSLLSFLQLPDTSTCRAALIQRLRNAEIGACNMERERPPYLPEIKAEHWSAPWLTLIGVTVLTLAIFGIRQHFATQDAWNQRFIRQPAASVAEMRAEAEREAVIAEIRLRRAHAEREAMKARGKWRCIDRAPFRQIPGGWEHVPGESC